MNFPVIIVGTGLAGYNLAREFRKKDPDTPLVLVTEDEGDFYSKPMLSTAFSKDKTAESLIISTAKEMEEQLDASVLVHTQVISIDSDKKQINLSDNTCLIYRDLVLALGTYAIDISVPGDAYEKLVSVNSLGDYRKFRQLIHNKSKVLVLGAGLVGCEFANDLILSGHEVELAAACTQIMPGFIPKEVADAVQSSLVQAGVVFHLNTELKQLKYDENQRVSAMLSTGCSITCDVVLSAIGLKAHTLLAKTAGIAVNDGIIVDRFLQTSCPNIYALGDCAEVDGLNLLYVLPLMAGARALASTLSGQATKVSYGVMPIMVKTTVCPLVVSSPNKNTVGSWSIDGYGSDLKASYYNDKEQLQGYALTGNAVAEKLNLNKQLTAVLS